MLNIQKNRLYSHIWSSSIICYNSRNNLYFKFVFVEWSIYIALNKINITCYQSGLLNKIDFLLLSLYDLFNSKYFII